MGELADDKINGLSCFYCGVYFEKEHGYPVLCNDCWRDFGRGYEEEGREGLQKAKHKEL